jgi:Domain of unknown function (DUF4399)
MKLWQASGFIICVALLNACGNKPPPPAPTSEPAASTAATPATAAMPRTAAPAGAKVSIVSPANGEKLKSPVTVKFAIEGMSLAPAGSSDANSGHHHLLVDTALPDAMGQAIAKDGRHLHFGKGQTETQIDLPPGEHTLQLLLGDGNHVPHDPPVYSQQILITVE